MKKILIYTSLFLLIISYKLAAQAVVTTVPRAFKADEEIKIVVDVSKVPILAGKPGPMYIWTWMPNDPPIGNGDWGNSNEALKMIKENDNVWSFTMTPTTFYGKAANVITEIKFLVKEKNGNGDKKTADLSIKPYDFSQLNGKFFTTYPESFHSVENVSIILNAAEVWNETKTVKGELIGSPSIYIWAGINDFKKNSPFNGDWNNSDEKSKLTNLGNNVWRIDFVSKDYFQTNELITQLDFLFKNKDGSKSGRSNNGNGNFHVNVNPPPGVKEPEIPQRIFPTKFSENDVVTIYYDLKIAEKEELKALTDLYIYTAVKVKKANGTEEDWQYQVAPWDQVGNTPKLKLSPEGNNVFSLTFIPRKLYNVAPSDHITQLNIIFRNKQGTVQTSNIYFEVFCK